MKKIKILLVLTFLFSSVYVKSQDKDSLKTTPVTESAVKNADDFRKFRIGVLGDVGVSWLSPKNKIYQKNGSRFVAGWGMVLDWNFTENYTFSSGFNIGGFGGKLKYDHNLYKLNGDTVIGFMERRYKIKYLTIPLNLKLKTNQIGYFTYYFQIGLNNAFRLSALADDNFSAPSNSGESYSEEDIDIKGTTSLYNLSFTVGAGAEYQISRSLSFFGTIIYDNGLINPLKGTNSVDPTVKENAIVNRFALRVGFLF